MSVVVEAVSSYRDKVWRVVRAIILDMVSAIILPIMRVIRWVLLAINESHSIHAVVLHVGVLVPPHDELLLGSFETNRSNRLVTSLRDVDICQVLLIVVL